MFHLQRGCVVRAPSKTARPPCIPGEANIFSLVSLPGCKVESVTFTQLNSVQWEPSDAEGALAPRAAGKGKQNVMFHSMHHLG